jgi:hypothetical protein
MRTIEKARAEVARGRLWRAKELLQGSLGNFGYNLELYEEYGSVLMQMGDLPAAGKFLFLSGVRRTEYDEPIALYLKRHKGSPAQLFSSFPRKARLTVLATYPKAVESDLRQLGFPNNLSLFPGAIPWHGASHEGKDVGYFGLVVLLTILAAILVLVILGFIKLREIFIWFRS